MSKLGTFTSHIVHTIGFSAVTTLASVAASILTARLLGPSGRGAISLLVLIPILVITFGRLGVGHAINYYASRWPKEELISSVLALTALIGVGCSLIGVPVILATQDAFFRGIPTPLILLACGLIPVSFIQEYLVCLFQGYYDIRRRNVLLVAGPLLNLLLLVLLVAVMNLGVFGAILAYLASNVAIAAWSVVLVLKLLGGAAIRPVGARMKDLVTYGLQSHLGLIFKELNYRGDTLLVSYFLGPTAVGLYSAAANVAEMLWKLPEAIGTVLLPRVAHLDQKTAAAFTASVLRALLLPMVASCIAVLLLGRYIVLIMFGAEFSASVETLQWLLPGVFAMAFWKIMANALIGLGKAIKYSMTSGVALIFMFSLDVILIPPFGLVGAAVASSASYLVATTYITYLLVDATGLPFRELWRPRRDDLQIYYRLLNAVGVATGPGATLPR